MGRGEVDFELGGAEAQERERSGTGDRRGGESKARGRSLHIGGGRAFGRSGNEIGQGGRGNF